MDTNVMVMVAKCVYECNGNGNGYKSNGDGNGYEMWIQM